VLVSGVWNSFIKLGMPVLALVLVALQGGATAGRVIAALLGIAGLVAAIVVFALLLRSEDQARRFGVLAGRAASRVLGLVRRPPVAGWELATVKFRARTIGLVEGRWIAITLTSLVSHLSLYAVLLVALRDVGVSDAEVSWAPVLAVFALARPATAIPLTPAGSGSWRGAGHRAGRGGRRPGPGGRRGRGRPGPHLGAPEPGRDRLFTCGGGGRHGRRRRRTRSARPTRSDRERHHVTLPSDALSQGAVIPPRQAGQPMWMGGGCHRSAAQDAGRARAARCRPITAGM
jgi:hypothetical protein